MNTSDLSISKTQIALAGGAIVALGAIILLLGWRFEVSWQDVKSWVEGAPAWIFIISLTLLPPFGVPLSLFLFAVGARFGLLYGTLIACGAIVVHHLIASCVSRFFSGFQKRSEKHSSIWAKLESKAGGSETQLLLLWGLLPGLPYIMKLYIPLAMGVRHLPYLKWNTLGHLLGAVLFVSFGDAVFQGASLPVIIVIIVALGASLAFKIYRKRLAEEPV